MSMNLYCDKVRLWQTPTWVTNICLSLDENGNPDGGMDGVKRRYKIWVSGTLNGRWNSIDELEFRREEVKEHINELDSYRNLKFYVL
jgi:hypothetical protein